MKKLSYVFVIILMVINFANGLTNVFQYDAMVQIFAQAGMEFPISKAFYIAFCVVMMIIPIVFGAIDIVFLSKKDSNASLILGMGIASIFFVGLLAGIFMIVYANQLKAAKNQSAQNVSFSQSPNGTMTSSPRPSDYDAPRDFFKVGDEVLVPDGRKGKITSIQDSLANIHFEDGDNDLLVGTDALKRP